MTPPTVSDHQKSTKHTPGPWVVKWHGRGGEASGANGARVISSTGLRVVTLPRIADRPYWAKEADARLIAAAPELLSALKDCLAHVPESEWVTRRYVSDLIARAEGQAGQEPRT